MIDWLALLMAASVVIRTLEGERNWVNTNAKSADKKITTPMLMCFGMLVMLPQKEYFYAFNILNNEELP